MNGIYDDQHMEQRSLPIVLFVLAFCLVSGFVITDFAIECFSLKQIWSDCYKWLQWRVTTGWLFH